MSHIDILVCDRCGTVICPNEPRALLTARVRSVDLELHYHESVCWTEVHRAIIRAELTGVRRA